MPEDVKARPPRESRGRPEKDAEPEPISRRQFILRNGTAAGTLVLGEKVLAEGDPKVTIHRRLVRGLRAPVRLVQLTDLHRSWCVSETYLHRVVAQANALKPDAALLTGDFVTTNSSYMASCTTVLRQIHTRLGSFAVLGNHDYGCDHHRGGPAITEALTAAGVHVLTNKSVRIEDGLWIVGVDDYWTGNPDLDLAFRSVKPREPAVVMTHNPMIFPWLGKYDCITVAGHTHGGQINIPVLTRELTYQKHHYLRGWFHATDGPGSMYVSRGVGVVGIPVRVRCDPEIALFDLVPA